MSINFPGSSHTMSFVAFSRTLRNLWENPYIPHMLKYTMDGNWMGKKQSCYGKSMVIDFPGFTHTIGFVAFSHTVGNLWGNPCISHMLNYTIGWESHEEKALMLWEKYEYQFPRPSSYHGFCCIFPYCGKFMGKPMHFPYAEVYHKMGI